MKKVYLASPFFNDEELKSVKEAEIILRDKGFDVFSPREHENREYDVGTTAWADAIFKMDKDEIISSDIMVMLYFGNYSDSGTAWEAGFAFANNVPSIIVHLGKDSNLMVHCGSYSNVVGLEGLKNYDFEKLEKIIYTGNMY